MKSMHGFVVLYAINDSDSFEKANKLIQFITKVIKGFEDTENVPVILVANKIDLEEQRQVSSSVVQSYVSSHKQLGYTGMSLISNKDIVNVLLIISCQIQHKLFKSYNLFVM